MRVLFCTDGSKISHNALLNFINWSKPATIDVISVIDWSFLPDGMEIQERGFSRTCANIADEILNKIEKEIKSSNMIMGDKIKHCGEVVSSILEQINSTQYEMVIMGSHGKKGIQRWLGSVSNSITDNTSASVYISKNTNCGRKILFATDGTENSNFAISEAIKYLDLKNKEIYVCVVYESPSFLFLEGNLDTNWLMEIEKRQEKMSANIIADVRAKLSEYDLNIKEHAILSGIPAEEITDFAQNEGIDLIVAGSKGKLKFKSSVSKKILTTTNSDVLILKN